ncbi:MAG: iron chelate uptake ABC transporter family permease subunit [Candidatus Glassbacteria bacterium]
MMEMLIFMAAPFTACLVLIGMRGYLGQHVLKREIIFIDISLAQIATLGATAGFILGIDLHSGFVTFFSLGAVAFAAFVFAFARYSCRMVPQEAVIGVSYAVATMAAIIMIDKAAGGHEHIREMLSGSILWVHWEQVGWSAAVFSLVGLFHFFYRDRFNRLSLDYDRARSEGMRVRLWDFFFYLSFGVVMIYAVQIAGILLVFSFLIIPATISILLAQNWGSRIGLAWAVGAVVSLIGLVLSWKMDLQSGPTIVCLLGAALLIVMLVRRIILSRKERVIHQY